MKFRTTIFIALLCLFGTLIPESIQAAPPVVTLKWNTAVRTWPIPPDEAFQPGKKLSSTTSLKKVKAACDDLVGIVGIKIYGVSGRELGKSSSNSPKLANKVISSQWGKDENGEDNYYLKFICAGSASANLIGNSNSYRVGLLKLPSTRVPNTLWEVGSSPMYSLDELRSAKWIVTFNLNDEFCGTMSCPEDIFCDDEECPVINESTWNPIGTPRS